MQQMFGLLLLCVYVCVQWDVHNTVIYPFRWQQLSRIYMDMLNIYKLMSQNINQEATDSGEQATKQPLIKGMRSVKKAILNVLSCWVRRAKEPEMVSCSSVAAVVCV